MPPRCGWPRSATGGCPRRCSWSRSCLSPWPAGGHLLGAYFYRGAQIIAPGLDAERREAYITAVNAAVDVINAAPWPELAEIIVAETRGALAPDRLGRDHIRYTHAEPYTEKRFIESYAWMKAWGLTSGASGFRSLLPAR